jgi:hypothetical protein
MSAEAVQIMLLEQEEDSSFYSHPIESDQSRYREPILRWDRIANRWPRERFPSFISHQFAVEGQPW